MLLTRKDFSGKLKSISSTVYKQDTESVNNLTLAITDFIQSAATASLKKKKKAKKKKVGK